MHIEHIALWVNDLEVMKSFYERYFKCTSGKLYINPSTSFCSYFLTFDSGSRIELMYKPSIMYRLSHEPSMGYTHLAFAAGDHAAVDALTRKLKEDGYMVVSEPRITGDGYYESVILDPENNRIELLANVRIG